MFNHYCLRAYQLLIVLILLLFTSMSGERALAQVPRASPVAVQFIGTTSLDRLLVGEPGSGALIYYLPERGPEHPSLVVRLSKAARASQALAEVFDAPEGQTEVPIRLDGTNAVIADDLTPSITMTALDGWWVRDGRRSFNLDVQVNGPIVAMWGTDRDQNNQTYGWLGEVQRDEPAVAIQVRDPHGEGLPAWELRSLIPPFPGRGYYRTNYVERRCETPLTLQPGVSPEWPFVAESGAFEQARGKLLPPIVVDWQRARVTYFAEIVTARHQNCSYTSYSIAPLTAGATNQANFETPFAFYDLSGQGQGAPNLIVRAQRFAANDPWSSTIDTAVQNGRAVPHEFGTFRYSWRDAVGDETWDYKVELFGSHPYTFTTPIAGGSMQITAPPYDRYPQWVMQHQWPAATFIDTEGHSYASSEGIYEWSPIEAGIGYILGRDNTVKPNVFTDIHEGFRGEYRLRQDRTATLYFSPIDNRLHLLGAEGGVWKLDVNQVVRVGALNGGNYIDSWLRQRLAADGAVPTTDEQLYAFKGYLLHADKQGVRLKQMSAQPALFELLPPTDHATWQDFQARLAPYATQKRDPRDMRSWLDAQTGQTELIPGAQISDVRATSSSFRFTLRLPPDFTAPKDGPLDLHGVKPGTYAVTYDGRWSIAPLTPAAPSASLVAATLTELEPGPLHVTLANSGQQDMQATVELWAAPQGGAATLAVTQTVSMLAQSTTTTDVDWAAPKPGTWTLTPRLREASGETRTFAPVEITVLPLAQTPADLFALSTTRPMTWLLFGGLCVLAMLIIWISWLQLTARRNRL